MSELPMVLHHYEASPYAEKIRLMFGIGATEWLSVLSPPQPPRPNVDPLTGGYRRIPVAQQGADIFCDTTLISEEVARLTGCSALDPKTLDGAAAEVVSHAEGEIFFAAITSIPPMRLIGTLLGNYGLLGTLRFIKDRTKMMDGGTVRPLRGEAALQAVEAFMERLDSHLASSSFIGGDEIGYADVSVFHPLWLHLRVGKKTIPEQLKHLGRWYADVESRGHGKRRDVSPETVFSAARANEPRPLPAGGDEDGRLGTRVAVAPADYGRDPVEGELVWMGEDRLILARHTDAFGTLHAHFPRANYEVTPL